MHQKKRVRVGNKWVWKKPVYLKLKTHKLPDGHTIKVKAGTQIIDRAWQYIKKSIGNRGAPPNSPAMRARVRSAQWEYWNRGKDLWAATGELLADQMEREF